jgi:hypothetical protein
MAKWVIFGVNYRRVKLVGTKRVKKQPVNRVPVSVRLDSKLIQELDQIAKDASTGRAQILEAILRKVFSDPRFTLNIDEL